MEALTECCPCLGLCPCLFGDDKPKKRSGTRMVELPSLSGGAAPASADEPDGVGQQPARALRHLEQRQRRPRLPLPQSHTRQHARNTHEHGTSKPESARSRLTDKTLRGVNLLLLDTRFEIDVAYLRLKRDRSVSTGIYEAYLID